MSRFTRLSPIYQYIYIELYFQNLVFFLINIEREEEMIAINTICPKIIRPTRSAGGLGNEKTIYNK